MNELIKSALFGVVAVVLVVAAFATRPSHQDMVVEDKVGQILFPEFTDPNAATSLEILTLNEELATDNLLEVAKESIDGATDLGVWVIPSHGNYPADAQKQMEVAATALIDLKILGVASELSRDHALFGVLEPGPDVEAGTKGVGVRVTLRGENRKELASLVIGKEAEDQQRDQGENQGQRFVRIAGQDAVYVVKIDPKVFSTKFEDWIEKDLLKLNSGDIDTVTVKDYSTVRLRNGFGLDPRGDMTISWDSLENKWKLDSMVEYNSQGEPIPSQLLPVEELNSQTLNDLKFALDDLEIVDVRRKPRGLGADLKVSPEVASDNARLSALMDSLTSAGFYLIGKLDGSEPMEMYSSDGDIQATTKDGIQYILRFGNIAGAEDAGGSLKRFLFVAARLDESRISPPALTPLPELPAGTGEEPASEGDAKEPKDDPRKAERERIQQENDRKQKEYDDKLAAARRKVEDLNARFGDWYYVISDEVYRKIHLGRDRLIKERDSVREEGFGVDAFRNLEEGGLEGKPETPAPPAGGFPGGGFPGGFPGGLPGQG